MGVGAFSVIYVRQRVIDFTIPFYEDSNAILIPPPFKSTQLFVFAKPFKPVVWLLLATIVFILSFTMWIQDKIFKPHDDSRLKNPKTISSNGFLFIYGILFTQCKLAKNYIAEVLKKIFIISLFFFSSWYAHSKL